jgi:hypothetical protein
MSTFLQTFQCIQQSISGTISTRTNSMLHSSNLEVSHHHNIGNVGVFIIYFNTKCHMPSYRGLLVTATKPTGKYKFYMTAMLFYILKE